METAKITESALPATPTMANEPSPPELDADVGLTDKFVVLFLLLTGGLFAALTLGNLLVGLLR